ncbi:hypothetical protein [Hirschia baltica]|uniref:Lipoprotein n=1 Tax=Hirschia baltica (strain ATCC 49814 / DSM 5838 / IFAM 1418) TaxID=582402 RepID=C6XK64_HIRBI|nr:hypothetical protein [Hirschia baltica]ACT59509.1 hypothetical protein Hbal_1823 [Hirschia baltica ATCC 49814]
MKSKIAIATSCVLTLGLGGCISSAIGVAGNVVEGTVKAPFKVAGAAVDQVTTSDEEQMKKDWKKQKKAEKKNK